MSNLAGENNSLIALTGICEYGRINSLELIILINGRRYWLFIFHFQMSAKELNLKVDLPDHFLEWLLNLNASLGIESKLRHVTSLI